MGDSATLIQFGGLLLLFLAVFCQTGVFFCFFIPSGGLLFTSGVLVATGKLNYSLFENCSWLVLASWLGNFTGYFIGWKAGPFLLKREDSRFFKRQYFVAAESFYHKHGKLALAAGLFFPVIRTFSPLVAGIIKVSLRSFSLFTFIGSVLWISSFAGAGYVIGRLPFLKPYLPYLVGAILLSVTLPILLKIFRQFRGTRPPGNIDD